MLKRTLKKCRSLYKGYRFQKACNRCLTSIQWAQPDRPRDDVSVHFLLGKKQLAMTALAACSFQHFSRLKCEYVFHDDGSLQAADVDFLKSYIPTAKVWMRDDADRAVADIVNSPAIMAARKTHPPLMLKLVDVFELSQTENVFFIDSDVLFFQEPKEFLDPEDESKWYFNRDFASAYILQPEEAKKAFDLDLIERINTGLWRTPRSLYSREFLIEILEHPDFELWRSRRKHVAEQTMAALLACRSNAACFLPPTYDVSVEKQASSEVCKHYVGEIRDGFASEGVVHLMNSLPRK